jgi:hypothetical protein
VPREHDQPAKTQPHDDGPKQVAQSRQAPDGIRDATQGEAGRGQQAVLERLSPAERRVVAAYQPLLARERGNSVTRVRVEGLETRTEQVTDGVARVYATAGRLIPSVPGESHDLGRKTAGDQAPYVVTIQRDGTWYPSLVFTATDWMLHRAERERP